LETKRPTGGSQDRCASRGISESAYRAARESRRTAMLSFAAPVCLLLAIGCNRIGLERDITALLSGCGATPSKVKAQMSGRSREGIVETVVNEDDLQLIISGLKLQEVPLESRASDAQFRVWHVGAVGQYRHPLLTDSETVRIFKAGPRTPELKLKNGGAFEYLLLYVSPGSNKILILVSYSYG